jgi:hypothetical protein
MSRLTGYRSTEYHEAPFWVEESVPLPPIIGGSGCLILVGRLVVTLEVAFDEVSFFKGVLDCVAVVAAR